MPKLGSDQEFVCLCVLFTTLKFLQNGELTPDNSERVSFLPYYLRNFKNLNVDERLIEVIKRGLFFDDLDDVSLQKEVCECLDVIKVVFLEKYVPSLEYSHMSWPEILKDITDS